MKDFHIGDKVYAVTMNKVRECTIDDIIISKWTNCDSFFALVLVHYTLNNGEIHNSQIPMDEFLTGIKLAMRKTIADIEEYK